MKTMNISKEKIKAQESIICDLKKEKEILNLKVLKYFFKIIQI